MSSCLREEPRYHKNRGRITKRYGERLFVDIRTLRLGDGSHLEIDLKTGYQNCKRHVKEDLV